MISPITKTIQITKICDKTLLLMKEDCISPQIPLSLWVDLRGEAKLNWVWEVWRLKSLLRPLLGSGLESFEDEKIFTQAVSVGWSCSVLLILWEMLSTHKSSALEGCWGWASSRVSLGEAKLGHCIKAVCSCSAKGILFLLHFIINVSSTSPNKHVLLSQTGEAWERFHYCRRKEIVTHTTVLWKNTWPFQLQQGASMYYGFVHFILVAVYELSKLVRHLF